MLTWAYLQPKVGDRVDLRVVDASLASALFQGIPAVRLLAHAKLARAGAPPDATRKTPVPQRVEVESTPWETLISNLLGSAPAVYERVRRAVGRHARIAVDERRIEAPSDATVAVLAWAVACDPEGDASLSEIAPRGGEVSRCDPGILRACAAYDDRLASTSADKRAPAFEACVRLATRAAMAAMPSSRFRALGVQLEAVETGLRLLGGAKASIFPRREDDEIPLTDRRMTVVDRSAIEGLLARDPRQLGPAVWRAEQSDGGGNVQLATFLGDLGRLLQRGGTEGTLVAAIVPPDGLADAPETLRLSLPPSPHSWAPPGFETGWTASTAAALADAIEHGEISAARARTSVARGGDAAADAIGAEMLRVGDHAVASEIFAEILARSARPRDVLRLVTYFAMAPDPEPAARALGACDDAELPRVLKAWLQAMLPSPDREDGPPSTDSQARPPDGPEGADAPGAEDPSTARVAACIASLKPYPRLYGAVQDLLIGG
jgi:hypothetical protein